MKKNLLICCCFILFNVTCFAQSTNTYYPEPARFEFLYANNGTKIRLVLDSQTGKITLLSGWRQVEKLFDINTEDLTNGTATRNGRFRLTNGEDWTTYLIDTEDGRCWEIQYKTTGNAHEAKNVLFRQVLPILTPIAK